MLLAGRVLLGINRYEISNWGMLGLAFLGLLGFDIWAHGLMTEAQIWYLAGAIAFSAIGVWRRPKALYNLLEPEAGGNPVDLLEAFQADFRDLQQQS